MGIRWLSKWLLRKVESSECESAWELSSAGNFLRTMEGTQMITNCGLIALFFNQHYSWLRVILQIWFWRGYIFSLERYALFSRTKRSALRHPYHDLWGTPWGIFIFHRCLLNHSLKLLQCVLKNGNLLSHMENRLEEYSQSMFYTILPELKRSW